MNENIDLTKILKNCPKGTKLYTSIWGNVEFEGINNSKTYPIAVKLNEDKIENLTTDGKMYEDLNGECILFPSREQRDWSKFLSFQLIEITQEFLTNFQELIKQAVNLIYYNMEFEYITEKTAQKFNNLLKETIEFCHNKRNYNKTNKDMNENIDLTKILKDCPKGTKFYSTIFGEVEFLGFCNNEGNTITIKRGYSIANITKDGRYISYFNGECTLFPSKEQRDWSKFTAPWYKKEIEHKFHVGQYITDGYIGGQITSIEDNYNCYKILDFNEGTNITIPFTLQDNYHLWTIQDAKDGDVLALSWWEDKNLWEKIIIFKKYHNEGIKGLYYMPCVEGYGNTFKNGKIAFTEKVPYYSKTWTCNLHPATKEQCDLLFQKIKEAGYKWNDETKTLEKLVKSKFNPKTLKPFDKVLARDGIGCAWKCDLFSYIIKSPTRYRYRCVGDVHALCIPYNDETKHLVGIDEEVPEYYRYWED